MSTHNKKVRRFVAISGVLALFALATPSWSQPPGGFDGPGGGRGGERGGRGFGMGRPDSAKFQLTRWFEALQRVDANSKTTLSKAQAKKLVAYLAPWEKKSSMSDKEASALQTRLSTVLTVAQKNQLKTYLAEGPGRQGGFGGGGFGGGGRGGRRGESSSNGRDGGFGGRGGGRDDNGPDGGFPGGPPPDGEFGGPGGFPGGPDGDFPGGPPPEGGFGGRGEDRGGGFGGRGGRDGNFRGPDGENVTPAQMKSRRETMDAFLKSNNPFASPKSSAQFAKMPERMRSGMLERYQKQNEFVTRLKKKAK